jgi:hypothetical protein
VAETGKRDALREELRSWGETQRAQAASRDRLVLACLDSGLFTKEEIHILTGLGRTTIDRIEKSRDRDARR